MRDEKPGTVEFLTQLSIHVLTDTAKKLKIHVSSFESDIASLRERSLRDGLDFFCKDLPALGKSLDRALALDSPLLVPPGFKTSKCGDMQLPKFLRKLWVRVFTRDGRIKLNDYDDTDRRFLRQHPEIIEGSSANQVIAVRAIRQICFLAYKLEGVHTRQSELDTLNKFIEVDNSLSDIDETSMSPSSLRALESARLLVWYALRGLDPLVIRPAHGPGALATGEKLWEKWNFSHYFPKLEELYCYADYFFFNFSHLCDCLETLERMETCERAAAKVVLVPKDSRGPRLISMEPLEIQWIQQGLARSIVERLESRQSPTFGFVNFTDQSINQKLALDSSLTNEFVTIDLEDASDRVSTWLVRKLFPENIANALFACRSELTLLPDGRLQELKKFAPMGSACCFPVEALIFWALAVGSLVDVSRIRRFNLPPVFVYGDDIIASKDAYDNFRPVFEECKLRFSETKCSVGRFFRESCGVDAFKGKLVTPVRLRHFSTGSRSPKSLLHLISLAYRLRESDGEYTTSANYVEEYIQRTFGYIPFSNKENGFPFSIIRKDMTNAQILAALQYPKRWNNHLQRYEVKAKVWVPRVITHETTTGWERLFSLIRKGPPDPFGFKEPVPSDTYTIPHVLKLRRKWVPITDFIQ